jgi:hypothetical protein
MDEKLLKQIEQYLKDSGLNADELRKRMDAVKASTTEFNRELINAQRHFAEMNNEFTDLADQLKNVVRDLSRTNVTSKDINSSFKKISGLADKLKYDSQDISRLSKQDLISNGKKLQIEINRLAKNKKYLDQQYEGKNLNIEEQKAIDDKNKSKLEEISQYRELLGLFDKEGKFLDKNNNYLVRAQDLNLKRLKDEEEIIKKLGISGKIVDGIVGALGKLGISSTFFENLKEDMRDTAKEGSKWDVLMTGVKGTVSGIGQALKDPVTQLTILLKIANFFFKAALNANAQAVELGKQLGYGTQRADAFREKMVAIESSSNNLNVTTANLTQAFGELVKATGFAYEFTADQLETQIKLTKQVGLQADEAAQIQRYSALSGKSSEETYKSFVKGLATARNQLRVGIDFRSSLAEAVKVSGQLAANLGYNPERIARAVVQAKALGTTLEDTKSQAESLLNFESSIENELKAELLTGQALNLERARALALQGDMAGVAQELANQGMTAAKFSKMNMLAQNAYAQSLGTTSDKLAEQLRKREEAVKSGKSLQQITEEEAAQALERQNIQDKFNAAVEKLQSLFGNLMAGPLGSFIDMLSGGLNIINSMIPALKTIGGLYLIIKGFQMAGNVFETAKTAQLAAQGNNMAIQGILQEKSLVKKAMYHAIAIKEAFTEGGIASVKAYASTLDEKSLVRRTIMAGITAKEWLWEKGKAAWKLIQLGYDRVSLTLKSAASAIEKGNLLKSIGTAAMGAIKSLSSIPVVGWALGLAAAGTVAALGYSFLKGDDVMSEGGYGKRTLLAPEGAIRLNDKDTVIAGTDLGGGNKKGENANSVNSGNSGVNIDLSPVVSALAEVKAAIDQLINKEGVVMMDSVKVGTTQNMNGRYKTA